MDVNGQSIDPTATPAITQNVSNQTGISNQGLANSYDGSSAGRGLLSGQSNNNFNSTLGFGNSAETAVIRARYMPQYQRQESQLSLDQIRGAQEDHIRNLQVATQAAGEEVQINRQKAILANQIDQQNKKARGAVLGTTLGIVGGVVGAVYGGPAGAAAGYGLGS